jgi:hypothetical protein
MIDERIEQALRSSEPIGKLRTLAVNLLADGHTRDTIVDLFERARQQLRQADREADEETVVDVMDFLVGWCSPHMKLPP